MSRRALSNVLLVVLLIAVICASFLIGRSQGDADESFAGTDTTVTEQIEADGYEPWLPPIIELQSGELESGLFALQAGLGGAVFGYCVAALQFRRTRREPAASAAPATPAPELADKSTLHA